MPSFFNIYIPIKINIKKNSLFLFFYPSFSLQTTEEKIFSFLFSFIPLFIPSIFILTKRCLGISTYYSVGCCRACLPLPTVFSVSSSISIQPSENRAYSPPSQSNPQFSRETTKKNQPFAFLSNFLQSKQPCTNTHGHFMFALNHRSSSSSSSNSNP